MTLDSHEIKTEEEFEGLHGGQVGWIVNVDAPTNRNTAHRPNCDSITIAFFREKVVDNGSRNGSYYHFLRLADAERELDAVCCARCN